MSHHHSAPLVSFQVQRRPGIHQGAATPRGSRRTAEVRQGARSRRSGHHCRLEPGWGAMRAALGLAAADVLQNYGGARSEGMLAKQLWMCLGFSAHLMEVFVRSCACLFGAASFITWHCPPLPHDQCLPTPTRLAPARPPALLRRCAAGCLHPGDHCGFDDLIPCTVPSPAIHPCSGAAGGRSR